MLLQTGQHAPHLQPPLAGEAENAVVALACGNVGCG